MWTSELVPTGLLKKKEKNSSVQHSLRLDDTDWILVRVSDKDQSLDCYVTFDQWLDLTRSCPCASKDPIWVKSGRPRTGKCRMGCWIED